MERDEFKYWCLVALVTAALGGIILFTGAALYTGEWRYLAGTLVALLIIRPLFT